MVIFGGTFPLSIKIQRGAQMRKCSVGRVSVEKDDPMDHPLM